MRKPKIFGVVKSEPKNIKTATEETKAYLEAKKATKLKHRNSVLSEKWSLVKFFFFSRAFA